MSSYNRINGNFPWVVYQIYGDKGILEENWKCMHEWVDYIKNNCEENGLWQSGFQYGDWLALDKEESVDRTGATTIWERWNSIKPDGTFDESGMNSLNHYAYGSIGDWMYRKVAGLSQLEPGYKKFQVKPMFVKGIEEWGTEFESVYGKIVANTSCRNGKIHVHVEVPANTTAVIILPEKEEVHEVGSGIYDHEYETETCLAVERFSMDSTLGEIVAEPLAVEIPVSILCLRLVPE